MNWGKINFDKIKDIISKGYTIQDILKKERSEIVLINTYGFGQKNFIENPKFLPLEIEEEINRVLYDPYGFYLAPKISIFTLLFENTEERTWWFVNRPYIFFKDLTKWGNPFRIDFDGTKYSNERIQKFMDSIRNRLNLSFLKEESLKQIKDEWGDFLVSIKSIESYEDLVNQD